MEQLTLDSPRLRDPLHDRAAPHHRDAPDTEVDAATLIRPRAGILRALVLDTFAAVWPDGLTDPELAEATGKYLYTVAPRRNELRSDGWLEETSQRRSTDHGRKAVVWRLSGRGARQLGLSRGGPS